MIKRLLFSNNSVGQTIVKNMFWLMSGEAVSRIIRAGVVIYAARILGAASYGAFAFAMAISNFLAIFSDFGLTPILSREIARNPEEKKRYLFHSIVLKAGLLLINVLAVLFIIPHFVTLEGSKILFPLVAVMLVFDSARDLTISVFRAMERMELEAAVKIFANLIIAGLGVYFLKFFASSFSLMGAYVIGGGLGFILGLTILLPFLRGGKVVLCKEGLRTMFSSAWPVAIMALMGTVLLSTDIVMLGWLSSPEQVGFYAAAQRPIYLFYMLLTLIGSAFFPIIMRLSKQGASEKLIQLAKRAIKINFAFGLPMLVGGILLQKEIIVFLYGEPFLAATSSFVVLLFILIIMTPSSILSSFVIAYDLQKKIFPLSIFTALLNIILNLSLIPIMGIVGAAFSTIFSQILMNFFLFRTVRKAFPFPFISGGIKIIIAAILMGFTLFILKAISLPILALIGIGILVYFFTLLLLREASIYEILKILKGN